MTGNSQVHDPEVAEHGSDWRERFPEVFSGEGYPLTFKGIHDANPLFGGASTVEHILDAYDQLNARSMGTVA